MSTDFKYVSFIKACKAYFNDRPVTIPEYKELTVEDKFELSDMLNEIGFTHPRYEPVATDA